jgi:hypothetical protein
MYTVSTTLVSAGPLCGAGDAARGSGSAAARFAVIALAAFSGFPAEASSRAARRTPDAPTTTASTK